MWLMRTRDRKAKIGLIYADKNDTHSSTMIVCIHYKSRKRFKREADVFVVYLF